MPRKTLERNIEIAAMNMADIKRVVSNPTAAGFPATIAAAYELDNIIKQLKSLQDDLVDKIESTELSTIKNKLIEEGAVGEDEIPVIVVGGKYKIKLSEKIKSNFSVDKKKLTELGDLVPEKYKKVSTTLDTKLMENDFDEGTMDPLLKPYITTDPKTVTVMSRLQIKGTSTEEEES